MAISVSITLPADGAVVSVDPLQSPSCSECVPSPLGNGDSTHVDSADAAPVVGASEEAACGVDLGDGRSCALQLGNVEPGKVDISEGAAATAASLEASFDSAVTHSAETPNFIDCTPRYLRDAETTDVDHTQAASEDVRAQSSSVDASAEASLG